MKNLVFADYFIHTAFNPVYAFNGQLLAVDLLSSFIHHSQNIAAPQDILLAQADSRQRLQILQKQISVIEKHHDFFLKNNFAVILSIDHEIAQQILSSDFLLHKLRSFSALELSVGENFPGFKSGRENPILNMLSYNFKLTLHNFGSGIAPAKAVYDNLFTRIKLDKYFLQQTLRRTSYSALLNALVGQVNEHCQQLIAQGIDDVAMLDKITPFPFAGLQGALFSPVSESELTTLTRVPEDFSDDRG